VYWSKFGQPKGYLTRIGDSRDIPTLWWLDPDQARRLDSAMKDPSVQLGEGPTDDKYWLQYAQTEAKGSPESR
jgi:hypothetical protein